MPEIDGVAPAAAPSRVTRARAQATRLREHLIAALARRAQAQQGTAREAIEARLARLRAMDVADDAATPADDPAAAAPGPLTRLLSALEREGRLRRPEAASPAPVPAPAAKALTPRPATPRPRAAPRPRVPEPAREPVAPPPAPAAEPETLQYFRRTWSRLSAEQRVAQSLSALPGNAGPLHSQQLLHRALLLMREVSPDYLERFVTQVDALLWLESANAQAAAAPAPAPAKSAAERRVARPR